MEKIQIYDGGEAVKDRYLLVFMDRATDGPNVDSYESLRMSADPLRANGSAVHCTTELNPSEILGQRIRFSDLPKQCQKIVLRDIDSERSRLSYSDYGLSVEGLEKKYASEDWGFHPAYHRSEWRDEVAQSNTISSYWQWVASQIEQERDECGDFVNAGLDAGSNSSESDPLFAQQEDSNLRERPGRM